MTLSNAAETDLLELLFTNLAWPNIGDAGGLQPSVAPGDLYISLHTADPGEAGNQTTSEATYTGYARIAVARSGAGFTVAGANVSNAAAVTFGEKTAGGDETITHFGIGTAASGVGNLLMSGVLTASLLVSNGITPEFAIGEMDVDAE